MPTHIIATFVNGLSTYQVYAHEYYSGSWELPIRHAGFSIFVAKMFNRYYVAEIESHGDGKTLYRSTDHPTLEAAFQAAINLASGISKTTIHLSYVEVTTTTFPVMWNKTWYA